MIGLTPEQIIKLLQILLIQIEARNNSKILKNKIHQLISTLQFKGNGKKVYSMLVWTSNPIYINVSKTKRAYNIHEF